MELIQTFRDAGVTLSSVPLWAIGLFGFVLWAIPLGFYVAVASLETEAVLQEVWYALIALHVGIGILVDVEAVATRGMFWPLQTVIIGGATFLTFSLPALLGYYIVQDVDDPRVALTFGALGTACVANAVMVSILFEYFHRRARSSVAVPVHTTSSAPHPPPVIRGRFLGGVA